MPHEYRTTRRVEWADTDSAGIIHFANYFRYMEEVEHEFLRSLGLSVLMEHDGHQLTWPRVSASCDFVRPVRFENVLDVRLTVTRIGQKSLTFAFVFSNDGTEVARGQLVTACCSKVADRLTAIPIPEWIRLKIDLKPEPN
ncbi:MAG: acyl-CoA thioesterase [Planctomycetes bacterium]|nr:acyl-CoA thioesterase [Planctomycetota bacterium]